MGPKKGLITILDEKSEWKRKFRRCSAENELKKSTSSLRGG